MIPAELTEVDDRDPDRLLVLSAWVGLPARLARPKAIPEAARIDHGQRQARGSFEQRGIASDENVGLSSHRPSTHPCA